MSLKIILGLNLVLWLAACATVPTIIEDFKNPFVTKTGPIQNGKDMAKLQSLLNEQGFNAGTPDGRLGPQTKNAIKAYQRKYGQHVDGKPTYALLDGRPIPPDPVPIPQPSDCVDLRDRTLERVFDSATEQIPIDIRPYLAGFCLPETRERMKKLYLYLVGRGAMHSRLTLVKYDALIKFYDKAGVDLGVRRDAFERSSETLNEDMRNFSNNRQQGAAQLLENYQSNEVKTLLENLPEGYENLEAGYKKEAGEIMSEALSHSISSTFYLVRSGYTAKRLIDSIDLGEARSTSNFWETINIRATQIIEDLILGRFIVSTREDMSNMLVASAHSVKTLTADIQDIPPIDPAETDKELKQLRKKNKISLDDFETAFEAQQQEQLREVRV